MIHDDGRGRACIPDHVNGVPIYDCAVYANACLFPTVLPSVFHPGALSCGSWKSGLICDVFSVCWIGRRRRVFDEEEWWCMLFWVGIVYFWLKW